MNSIKSCIDNHPLLESHIRTHIKLILGPTQHTLNILIVDEPSKVALLLASLEQPGGIVENDDQVAKFKKGGGLLLLFLQSDIVLSILQEEVKLDILKGWLIDKTTYIILQLVYILPLVFIPHFPQLLRLSLAIISLKEDLILVEFSIEFLEDEDQPSCEILDFVFALIDGDH